MAKTLTDAAKRFTGELINTLIQLSEDAVVISTDQNDTIVGIVENELRRNDVDISEIPVTGSVSEFLETKNRNIVRNILKEIDRTLPGLLPELKEREQEEPALPPQFKLPEESFTKVYGS